MPFRVYSSQSVLISICPCSSRSPPLPFFLVFFSHSTMIITDDTPESPAKTRNDELPPQYTPPPPASGPRAVDAGPVPSSSQPLLQHTVPIYGAASPQQPAPNTPWSEEAFQQHVIHRQAATRARRRFLKAFLYGVLIWLLIGTFIGTISQVRYTRSRNWVGTFCFPTFK